MPEDNNGQGMLALNTSLLSNGTQFAGEIFRRPADMDAVLQRLELSKHVLNKELLSQHPDLRGPHHHEHADPGESAAPIA